MVKKGATKAAPAQAEKIEKSEDELKKTTTDDGSSSEDEAVGHEDVEMTEDQKLVAEAAGLGEQVTRLPCFHKLIKRSFRLPKKAPNNRAPKRRLANSSANSD